MRRLCRRMAGGAGDVAEIVDGDEDDIAARRGGKNPAAKNANQRKEENVFRGDERRAGECTSE
ncbi:MAG: hypothetical protein ACREIA_26455 [Opitutaceae bacterium]